MREAMTLIEELTIHADRLEMLDAERAARGKAVGSGIRLARRDAGIPATSVAERAGISRAHLSHIENGRHMPTVETLRRITAAIEVDG